MAWKVTEAPTSGIYAVKGAVYRVTRYRVGSGLLGSGEGERVGGEKEKGLLVWAVARCLTSDLQIVRRGEPLDLQQWLKAAGAAVPDVSQCLGVDYHICYRW